ncbi:MAG: type III-A CRISPR-associated RAMP protein Csm4 [Coriobacteriia bacterium]|nr:type III-A CRISPR-associated RAMP protein Csm4 [Coriobacteriia bacterium]
MDTKTVKLNFLTPVHFGDGRLSDSKSTCDAATLFSALFIEALRLGLDKSLLEAATSGDLTISDALPFVGDTYYIPKPMMAPGVFADTEQLTASTGDSIAKKAFKKLNYISAGHLGAYLAGTLDPACELRQMKLGVSAVQTKVNLTREHKDDAEPYQVGSFSFEQDAGLYFIAQGSFVLEPLLEQLQYSGIGGERSSGYGRFTYSITEDNPLKQASDSLTGIARENCFILLSSSVPTASETSEELFCGARYLLVRKGGFVQSQTHSANLQKKRDLYAFAAGSVFKKKFAGSIFDVNKTSNAHPVYRYARAMWMEV